MSAKNALLNVYGYSPNQLVFGHKPNFPSVIDNKLPALQGVTSSKLIASHLNALHSARRSFIETEADEKLRRALRHQTRTATNLEFHSGDQVYYKKKDSGYWKGPGTVIGYDNKQIFIRHGGSIYRVSPCNLQLVKIDKSKDHENNICTGESRVEKREDKTKGRNRASDDSDIGDFVVDFQQGRKKYSQESALDQNSEKDADELI